MEIEAYLYEKVLSKIHYDKEQQQYIIKLEDYSHLNLSNKQFRTLKRICRKKGIKLEFTNAPIPVIEDLDLFKQYNEIKQKLSIDTDNQELEQRRIEIRNQIASQNFKAVRTLLNRRITGLPQMKDREDIYQLGYICLIEFIDSYDILKAKILTTAINKYLIYHFSRKIIYYQKNITNYTNKCMNLVNETLENTDQKDISLKELSEQLDIPEYHIKSLINLDEILEPISIEEEIEKLTKETIELNESLLYDDTFEINILNKLSKDIIMKILKTLPPQQMEVIMLYYGINNERSYNIIEIGKMYDVSKERIHEIKNEALKNLRNSIRTKYIIDSYDSDRPQKEIDLLSSKKHLKNLEETLIKLMLQNELNELINSLSPTKIEFLKLRLGLKDGICYSIEQISEILNIKHTKAYDLKEHIFKILKNKILRIYYQIDEPDLISYEDYLDYLIKLYLTKSNKKLERIKCK